ncbi:MULTISPECIES: hypothetical protein [Halorubrum]|uniref:hypothetical protein n=1 Tax=Halorubrum TaxID=56688 RepID=UPI000F851E0D|nr:MULTISPECIES: hypothetical protein [Halorubrum]AZQ15359.1 hypothetical protein DOS48_11245 [Halorubrum sp. PV6]
MGDRGPPDGGPAGGPAANVDERRLRRVGAALWTLVFLSVTAVILLSNGRLGALDWQAATLVAVRTFVGVVAFLAVFPLILSALSMLRLR